MRIVGLLFFLLSFNLIAQRNAIGLKVGNNLSHIVGDGTENVSFSIRPHFGVYMEIPMDDFGSFQPELLYTSYGYALEESRAESNIGLNYLALSVLCKILIIKNFSLDAGPQVGLLLSAKDREEVLTNLKSDFYNRDFGINLGVSYHFSKKFTGSFRHYLGLTDVTQVEAKNFNRSFQLAVQYKIN